MSFCLVLLCYVNVIMLSVVMLNVVMLSVIVPLSGAPAGQKKIDKRSSLFSRRGGNEENKVL